MKNINTKSGHSSLEPLVNKNNEFLFKINNTKQLVMMDLFWIFFFFLFVCALWLLFVNLEQNIGRTWKDLFIQEIYSPRFSSILVILFIVGPISTYFAVQKNLKKDNALYFYDNKITYHDLVLDFDEITEIKISCCPLINDNTTTYILVYGLGSFLTIPLKLFALIYFYILKINNINDIHTVSNNFIIRNNNNKNLSGTIYNSIDLINLQKYIVKKGICKPPQKQ